MIKCLLTKETKKSWQPKKKDILKWLHASLIAEYKCVTIEVIIIKQEAMLVINKRYRNIDKPTNVIAISYPITNYFLNGEIYLCDDVIVKEAREQNISILHKYIHMFVHGMLHLQGLDHKFPKEAKLMESKEIAILKKFSYSNPYTC